MGIELKVEGLGQRRGRDPKQPWLFRSLSFCWTSPSLHVVLGASGGGKSSFLKSIGGVWRPFEGSVRVNSKPLWASASTLDSEILGNLGFAFQNNALFGSMRVVENLLFPHRARFPDFEESKRRELALDWLKRVGLDSVATSFPFELSGGMQKRLSLARTLILEPGLIFLDDPTAGLDPITSRTISDLLQDLLKGREALVVIVTNDPDRALEWGPNVHILNEGSLFSPGQADYEKRRGVYL